MYTVCSSLRWRITKEGLLHSKDKYHTFQHQQQQSSALESQSLAFLVLLQLLKDQQLQLQLFPVLQIDIRYTGHQENIALNNKMILNSYKQYLWVMQVNSFNIHIKKIDGFQHSAVTWMNLKVHPWFKEPI